ncbi:DUF302 domain-containing protein [Acidicapsa ligni]|uniref:DUF302 domain-containing protein n=1 Tax=Acidicapsa ligni TaxID=542300 RepID=UPI0021E0F6F8|nr:DUF302 domain-containing protein [Acidicapsa ligni]
MKETLARLEEICKQHGVPVHFRVDHSGDAARVGLKMPASEMLTLGNPKNGTPLMIASPTVAIDLPLKALAWEDSEGKVWLTYNSTDYLTERHNLPKDLVGNIAVIKELCEGAVKP